MRFHSDPLEEHAEVPLPDDGRLEDLLTQWSDRRDGPALAADGRSACYVVASGAWRSDAHRDAQLGEALGLVRALGDEVVGHETVRLGKPHPKTWFGTGTCQAIADRARAHGATMLVVDVELSPSQTRNLEDATGLSVQDREGLILAVFHQNARTRRARIQVEIARLQYLRPRIRGLGLDMDQQAGGIMQGRGAGETASELLARQLDDRLVQLRRAFAQLERAGELQRSRRSAARRVALVGYTNAGKTSLMNALTGAGLSAKDQPFETLDTTTRALTRHGGDVVLGDTVGFIRNLPGRLLDSFASTLAEIREADVLALVVDLSDPEWPMHLRTTHEVLTHLGADGIDRLYVFNKVDRVAEVPEAAVREATGEHPRALVSALDPASVDALREALIAAARRTHGEATLEVPYAASRLSAQIHASCQVLDTTCTDTGTVFRVVAPAPVLARLRRALGEVTP